MPEESDFDKAYKEILRHILHTVGNYSFSPFQVDLLLVLVQEEIRKKCRR